MAALEKRAPSFSRIASASNCQTAISTKTSATTPLPTTTPSTNSTIPIPTDALKPLNIFYIWYYELCRRQSSHPLPSITHGSTWYNNQILDFTADRVKLEDWQPIINALRLDMSLHVICMHSRLQGQKVLDTADTEERVKKIKKWFGTICTKYILKNLLKAITSCLNITQVLSCLELDGLQISGEYLTLIIKGLSANKSVKYLSFKSCPIQDDGCLEICEALHQMPNIGILNLSSCGLGSKSGEYLGKVIKYQQINRYCESWHSSLRYEHPVVTNMAGLKRLTLNNNPGLGDSGTELILQELVDDLWIKALDMQRCGVTQRLAPKIMDILQYNKSLKVVDFRRNQLQPATVSKILEVLREKHGENDDDTDTEYQWCMTTTSLDAATSYGSYISLVNPSYKNSRYYRPKTTPKTPSVVAQKPSLAIVPNTQKVTKEKINNTLQKPDNSSLVKAKEQLMQLYEKLKEETVKREQAEKKCEELQKQVDELLTEQKNHLILKEFSNMKEYISKFISFVKQHGDFEEREPIIVDLQKALDEVQMLAEPYESPAETPKQSAIFNSLVEATDVKLSDDYTIADMKLQSMFQSMLGPSLPSLDTSLDLELQTPSAPSCRSPAPRPPSPAESSDSDSVETLKRLLEELGNDDEEGSWYTENVDTVSGPDSSSRN